MQHLPQFFSTNFIILLHVHEYNIHLLPFLSILLNQQLHYKYLIYTSSSFSFVPFNTLHESIEYSQQPVICANISIFQHFCNNTINTSCFSTSLPHQLSPPSPLFKLLSHPLRILVLLTSPPTSLISSLFGSWTK